MIKNQKKKKNVSEWWFYGRSIFGLVLPSSAVCEAGGNERDIWARKARVKDAGFGSVRKARPKTGRSPRSPVSRKGAEEENPLRSGQSTQTQPKPCELLRGNYTRPHEKGEGERTNGDETAMGLFTKEIEVGTDFQKEKAKLERRHSCENLGRKSKLHRSVR